MIKFFEYGATGMTVFAFIVGIIGIFLFISWLLLDYIIPKLFRHYKIYASIWQWFKVRKKFDEFAGVYIADITNEREANVRLQIIRELRYTIGRIYTRPDKWIPDEIGKVLASLGDTIDDDTALTILKHFNETGEVWSSVVANSKPV